MKRRALYLSGVSAAALGLYCAVFSWTPDLPWLSEALPGRFEADGGDESVTAWEGLWPAQRIELGAFSTRARLGALLLGRKKARIDFEGGRSRGQLLLDRSWTEPPLGMSEVVALELRASGASANPFALLQQIGARGEWELTVRAWGEDSGTLSADLFWELSKPLISFGPADRDKPVGTLRLDRLRATAQVRGAALRFEQIEGSGEGVELEGGGEVLLREKPEESTLNFHFTLTRAADSGEPVVPGWEEALAGSTEIDLVIEGWVRDPLFYVNGFLLVPEALLPAEKLPTAARGSVTNRLAASAAVALDYLPPLPDDAVQVQPDENVFSETDIHKLRAALSRKAERPNRAGGHAIRNTPWGKRRRQLKRAYKKELKKMKQDGVELPKKATRNLVLPAVDRQLEEEFGAKPSPEEIDAATQAAKEQAAEKEKDR